MTAPEALIATAPPGAIVTRPERLHRGDRVVRPYGLSAPVHSVTVHPGGRLLGPEGDQVLAVYARQTRECPAGAEMLSRRAPLAVIRGGDVQAPDGWVQDSLLGPAAACSGCQGHGAECAAHGSHHAAVPTPRRPAESGARSEREARDAAWAAVAREVAVDGGCIADVARHLGVSTDRVRAALRRADPDLWRRLASAGRGGRQAPWLPDVAERAARGDTLAEVAAAARVLPETVTRTLRRHGKTDLIERLWANGSGRSAAARTAALRSQRELAGDGRDRRLSAAQRVAGRGGCLADLASELGLSTSATSKWLGQHAPSLREELVAAGRARAHRGPAPRARRGGAGVTA